MQITGGIDTGELKDQFLTLLVTQLQNQDPIEPVKQENFIAQLAQFSTVEGIDELNVQFADVLYSQQVLSGFDLVDKNVSFLLPGDTEPRQGHVDAVFVEDGRINVVIGENTVPVNQVTGVHASVE
ncbi:MAG: flagellar hook assembly protein FlgD [Pirellulaceae bacterium]